MADSNATFEADKRSTRHPVSGGAAAVVVGSLLVLAAVLIGVGRAQTLPSASVVGSAANQELVSHLASQPGRPHLLILVDPETRTIATYEINDNGGIKLAAVRNTTWDLQMRDFNTGKPTPEEVRAALESAR